MDYEPTYTERVIQVGEKVVISNTTTGSTGFLTIYRVPENYELYIQNIWLSSKYEGINTGSANSWFTIDQQYLSNCLMQLYVAFGSNSNMVITYPHLLKIDSMQSLEISGQQPILISGGFTGFLIKKKVN